MKRINFYLVAKFQQRRESIMLARSSQQIHSTIQKFAIMYFRMKGCEPVISIIIFKDGS